ALSRDVEHTRGPGRDRPRTGSSADSPSAATPPDSWRNPFLLRVPLDRIPGTVADRRSAEGQVSAQPEEHREAQHGGIRAPRGAATAPNRRLAVASLPRRAATSPRPNDGPPAAPGRAWRRDRARRPGHRGGRAGRPGLYPAR